MTFLKLSRRTYAVLTTLGTTANHRLRSTTAPVFLGVEAFLQPTVSTFRQQQQPIGGVSVGVGGGHRLFSTFQAPEPPSSKGQAIFPDVDISQQSTSIPDSAAVQRNADPNAIFVVNGASRGIGVQMVKSLLDRTKGKIVACCRNPHDPHSALHTFLDGLGDDSSVRSRVDIAWLDLEDQSSIDALEVHMKNNHNSRVDGLFNVAGVLGDGATTPGPERSLARIERDWLEHTLAVNVVGHVMLIKALRTMLKTNNRSSKKDSSEPVSRPTSVVVNLSARVGSISDNELGGWYSYRISKAALNQATRTMAHELKRQGTYAIAVHPGTTQTDLSKPFQKNVKPEKLFPVDFTVNQILDVVDHLQEEHSGGLYDWAGKALPF